MLKRYYPECFKRYGDNFCAIIDASEVSFRFNPELFSSAIYLKGAPLTQCWGFIDGTVRPIPRPVKNQKILYSGHKRVHCIKFQVSLS